MYFHFRIQNLCGKDLRICFKFKKKTTVVYDFFFLSFFLVTAYLYFLRQNIRGKEK